jgi:predicted Rossmann fold flavoprotein
MKELGHDILPSHPALAPLKTSKMKSDKLNGVRLNAQIIITKQDDTIVGSEMGNIIFTEWGINGPGVMNLSHKIHDLKEKLNILIKFNYDNLENLIEGNFYRYRSSQIPLRNVLLSLYPAKLIDQMIYNSELNSNIRMIELSEKEILRMKENLTIKEKIIDTRDFNFSQISTGSISSRHVNTRTLESKLISGLFFAGEILDVIGPCGGYNLHWAFVSGIVAGNSI